MSAAQEDPRPPDGPLVSAGADAAGRGSHDEPTLPRSTRDDTDAGWGERRDSNDERLLADRPPHWG
ncbi:MAG TPA: hypothetical protein VF163_17335 [Micromonosporaceae bacterium]